MSAIISRAASAAIVALVVSLSYFFIWKPVADQQDFAWRALRYYKGQYEYFLGIIYMTPSAKRVRFSLVVRG